MSKGIVLAGAGLALVGIILFARKAAGDENGDDNGACFEASPGGFHYVTWLGKKTKLSEAFGVAWDVIFTVEFFLEDEREWWPASGPDAIIHRNEQIRFIVQELVEVCGFRKN